MWWQSFSTLRFLESSELVDVLPFDVIISLNQSTQVDTFGLTGIVEEWLSDAFDAYDLGASYATFDTVLLDRQGRRSLAKATTTFISSYEGASVWAVTGNDTVPTETNVAAIQLDALLDKDGSLLALLKAADPSTGLGPYVVAVKASISQVTEAPSDSSDGLDVITIVAIVVAGLAFALLVFALFMAYRHRNRRAGGNAATQKGRLGNEGTGSESEYDMSSPSKRASAAANAAIASPPSVIAPSESGGGLYPESLISEDISTSLTAYYRSGIGTSKSYNNNSGGGLNDAASVSSMESYGYSLDGYTNSIAPSNSGNNDPY